MTENWINELIVKHQLPPSIHETINEVYRPIAMHLNDRFPIEGETKVIGLNGCQGSGKSTMADFVQAALVNEHGRDCLILSLDDFYLSKSERLSLSNSVHPLLKTRGVPGTHNIQLLIEAIERLTGADETLDLILPKFDKGSDDLHPKSEWMHVEKRPDFIILEGWCVGANPQTAGQLENPINALEEDYDKSGVWRSFANDHLAAAYTDLFSMLNHLIVISPPTTDIVFKWRQEQEQKLRDANLDKPTIGQSDEELRFFIQHYQRLTDFMHNTLPTKADVLVRMNNGRALRDVHIK